MIIEERKGTAKILFLNPPHQFKISRASRWSEHTKTGTLYYPIWLAYACGYSNKKGHNAILIDAIANNMNFHNTVKRILEFNPDLLVVDSTTPSFCNDLRFLKELRKKRNVKTVLVGTHPSALPKETLKFRQIDFAAVGEYDATVSELANNLDKPQKVKGIFYRKDGKIIENKPRTPIENLDELPFVSETYKKFLDFNDYRYSLATHPMIQIMSSRGCPNRCTFCLWPQVFMGRVYRKRSSQNFVDELEYIKKEIPEIKEVFIEDDTFTIDRERVFKICDLIKKRKLNITWSVNVRADLPYELLRKMKKTGCRLVVVGYESGNQEILNNIKKGITLKQAEEFTKNAKKVGLKIFGCFMIGLPGDTGETVNQTFEFARKLNIDMAFFQQAVPFPGTEFYDFVDKKGFLVTRDFEKWLDKEGRLGFLVKYPNLSNKEISKLRDDLLIKFYLSPKFILYTFKNNLNTQEFKRVLIASIDYLKFILKRKI